MLPIESVVVGDIVTVRDDVREACGSAEVTRTHESTTTEILVIRLPNEEITCTGGHSFWVDGRGWREARLLTCDDLLEDSDGNVIPIIEITARSFETPISIYNIGVDGAHSYYVGCSRVLVHNKP